MKNLEVGAVQAKGIIRTHSVFRVLEFHPEDQTVDIVQDTLELVPDQYGQIYKMNDFGMSVPYALRSPDVLRNIPVKQLRWGQFSIKCCPSKGDTGYVEYFQDDIRNWVENGEDSVPWCAHKFLRGSCVFVPGVFSKKESTQDYPADNTKLIISSADARIELVNTIEDEPKTQVNIVAQNINVTADKAEFSGDMVVKGKMDVTGDIKSSGDVKAGNISLKDHKHTVPSGATVKVDTATGIGSVTGTATTESAK